MLAHWKSQLQRSDSAAAKDDDEHIGADIHMNTFVLVPVVQRNTPDDKNQFIIFRFFIGRSFVNHGLFSFLLREQRRT